ncbi:hypothetical protein [Streptomyces sp. AK02-04a]|uniref:lytic transglycosylase domain-containing protein n=1 Tax=Streptomyces sp. AK02-04a TaxID=3028649 RepID=UPI0029AAB63E|nr:hypothetical protein [Streptomyces sp. AK02-04a]MDX3763419.1 hypothetical protein [Streptomyces sp. AK02-04a]
MAYRRAAFEQASRTPGCHLPWTLLAAIGKVESNHARGGALTGQGFTAGPILGPVLDGAPFASLRDSDHGRLDGNTTWDRAVGPMQFIPPTWKRWGTTTRPTLTADPSNIFDASTSAASYLCANNRDLKAPLQLNHAILSYNPSGTYLRDVLAWNSAYASGQPVGTATAPAFALGPSNMARLAAPAKAVFTALHTRAQHTLHTRAQHTLHTRAQRTLHKRAQRRTPLAVQETTTPQQPTRLAVQETTSPRQVSGGTARYPVSSSKPNNPKSPLLQAGLLASKVPSSSPVAARPSSPAPVTAQVAGLVRRLGQVLPSHLLDRGGLLSELEGESAPDGA